MKELRAKISLDESQFLNATAKVENAVAKLGKAGLATSFVDSFKKIGQKGTFTGLLDGIEAAVRATQNLKNARASLAAAESQKKLDFGYLKQAAAELRGRIATPTSGLFTAAGAVAQIKPVAAELGKVKSRLLDLNATRLTLGGALGRYAAADLALEKAKNQVNAGLHPVTGAFTGSLSGPQMRALVKPFEAEFKAAQKEAAQFMATLGKISATQGAFDKLKGTLASLTQSFRGKTGLNVLSPDDARAKLKPLADAAKASVAAVKIGFADVASAALGSVVSFVGAAFSALKLVGSVLVSVVSTIGRLVSAALSVIGSFVSSILGTVTKIGGVLAAIGATTAGILAAGVKKAVDLGAQTVNLQARTGLGGKDQLVLGRAFTLAGLDDQTLAMTINRMQGALAGVNEEGKDTIHSLHALGLNIAELRRLTPTEQLERFGAAVANLQKPADRAAAVMDVFTKRGFGALQFFNQMATVLKTAREQWGAAADVMDRDKDKFAFVSSALDGLLHIKPQQFMVGVADGLQGALTFFADKFNKLDLTKLGQKVGAQLQYGIEVLYGAFQKKQLWNLAAAGLKAAFATAGDFLAGVLNAVLTGAGKILGLLFDKPEYFKSLGHAISAAFKSGLASFLQAFHSILPEIAAGLAKAFGAAHYFLSPARMAMDTVDLGLRETAAKAYLQEIGKEDRIRKAMAEGKTSVPSTLLGSLSPEGPATPAALAESQKTSADLFQRMQDADARIQARMDEYTGPYEDIARQWMAEKTAPENIARLKKESATEWQQAKPGLKAFGGEIADTLVETFKQLKEMDVFHSKELRAAFEALPRQLHVDRSGPPIPETQSGTREPDPLLHLYRRSHEAASSLEKVGASFNRDVGASIRRMGAAGSGAGYRALGQAGRGSDYRAMGQPGGRDYQGLGGGAAEWIAQRVERLAIRPMKPALGPFTFTADITKPGVPPSPVPPAFEKPLPRTGESALGAFAFAKPSFSLAGTAGFAPQRDPTAMMGRMAALQQATLSKLNAGINVHITNLPRQTVER